MRFQTKLSLAFLVLIFAVAASTAISVHAIREARSMIERMEIAHGVFQRYLKVSIRVAELTRVRKELALTGASDTDEADIREQLSQDLAILRDLIGRGIDVVGPSEIGELNRLAAIELEVAAAIRALEAVPILQPDAPLPDPEYMAAIIGTSFHARLSTLIDMTINEERGELRQTEADSSVRLTDLNVIAVVGLLAAVVIALVGIAILRRDLKAPLGRLVAGADAIGDGLLQHRIPAGGPEEFNRLAGAFNLMADRVLQRTRELSEARDTLEEKVRDRNADLEAALARLGEADTNRRRLLADVSHELRTPLSIIRGEADVALRSPNASRDDFVEAVSRMRDAAVHSARIVDDLLFVARSEEGTVRLNLRDADLVDIVSGGVETARGLTTGGRSVIRFDPDLGEAPLQADPQRIRQVALILMENAVRYGGDDIVIRVMNAPGGFAFSVADNGSGMSEEDIANAFRRFFRGHNAADSYSGGTGLGLPVAKAIVEAHGGTITLTSAPGEGLSATVILPGRSTQMRLG